MSTSTMLRMLHQLQLEARTAAEIERQAREAAGTNDVAVITERTAGNRRHKSLRVGTHVMDMEAVTRPADAEQLYVVKEG